MLYELLLEQSEVSNVAIGYKSKREHSIDGLKGDFQLIVLYVYKWYWTSHCFLYIKAEINHILKHF